MKPEITEYFEQSPFPTNLLESENTFAAQPEGDERFKGALELSREIGDNRERFWNMLVTEIPKTGFRLPIDRNTEVLDIGCGQCLEGLVLSSFLGNKPFGSNSENICLTGVDVDGKAIQETIQRYQKPTMNFPTTYELPPNFKFLQGDATRLDSLAGLPQKADVIVIRHQQISQSQETWQKIIEQALLRLDEKGILILTSFSDVEHEMLTKTLSLLSCEIIVNESNPYKKATSHPNVSIDRNVIIVKRKNGQK